MTLLSDVVAPANPGMYVSDFDPEQPWDNYRAYGVAIQPFSLAYDGMGGLALIQGAALGDGIITPVKLTPAAGAGDYTYVYRQWMTTPPSGYTWQKALEMRVDIAGTYTCRQFIKALSSTGYTKGIRIYKNGAAFGASHSTAATGTGTWGYTDDLAFAKDDLLQVYIYQSNIANCEYRLRLCCTSGESVRIQTNPAYGTLEF